MSSALSAAATPNASVLDAVPEAVDDNEDGSVDWACVAPPP